MCPPHDYRSSWALGQPFFTLPWTLRLEVWRGDDLLAEKFGYNYAMI